jgi:cell division cycle protein 20 (cofactor of APC complex)
MAETSIKLTSDEDINQYFQIDALTKSGKKAQTPRWGLKPTPSHRPFSGSRMMAPTGVGSPIQVRKTDNLTVGPSLSSKHKVRAVPLRDLENKLSATSISEAPKDKVGTGKKTPGRVTSISNGGDRFIPNRSSQNIEQSSFLLTGKAEQLSPGTQDYQDYLYSRMTAENPQKRVLAVTASDTNNVSIRTPHELVRSANFTSFKPSTRDKRVIPNEEEQILDAPGVLDDYYLNLVDWSRSNVLAIALHNVVYLWNADSGSAQELCQLHGESAYVSSVSWGKGGSYLAVGTNSNGILIWDVTRMKKLRSMRGHASRVGALSWRQHIVSSGSRDGCIYHHDVRAKDHITQSSLHHKLEVCGLKWSRDGGYLASGSNDNSVCVWGFSNLSKPLQVLDHNAAVKGLAWCPWQNSLLATGGGSADQHLRLWDIQTGRTLKAVDTGSQVTSIIWSKSNRELLTSHGPPSHQLSLWNEDLKKEADIKGHNGRILKAVRSPCGSLVASLSADETLRVWKCFDVLSDMSQSGFESFQGSMIR